MKLNSKTKFGAICVVLTLVSTQVSALTLGRMRGGALLGKPLDVTVLVQFGADEDVASTCFSADVAFGDTPLERSRVTVQSQPGQQANTQLVRVTSSARVDEAVVTVNLIAACGTKASRRYMLLAELVSEPGVDNSLATPSAASVAVATPKAAVGIQPMTSVQGPAVESKMPPKPRTAVTKPATNSVAVRTAAPRKSERDAAIKAANELNAAALEDLQRRVDDIATWQASSNLAEELLRSQAREKALESDIQGLRAVTAKNQQNLQTVATALEESEARNYSNILVYALAGILAICLGAVAYAYSRLRRSGPDTSPWWSGGAERAPLPEPVRVQVDGQTASALGGGEPTAASQVVQPPAPVVPAHTPKPVAPAAPPKPVVDDLSDDGAWASASSVTVPIPVAATKAEVAKAEVAQASPTSAKALNTQEMLDVRQQAEFFMALGQHDDAVNLLVSSISASDEANPLVYLDVLKIFHTLSRRAEFERYRADFNLQFTGRIPEYSNFAMEGNGLETYDDICQQIVVLWPTDYTVDFIEQCLVRLPEDDPEQGIDLEAFKDLLLLYGVLKRLEQTQDSVVVPFSATRNANSQMMTGSSSGGLSPVDIDTVPPLPTLPVQTAGAQAADLDLDIDVDLDLDLDLDVEVAPAQEQAAPVAHDNLINFDMSGFDLPTNPKPPQK